MRDSEGWIWDKVGVYSWTNNPHSLLFGYTLGQFLLCYVENDITITLIIDSSIDHKHFVKQTHHNSSLQATESGNTV